MKNLTYRIALALAVLGLVTGPLFAAGPDPDRHIVVFKNAAQGKAALQAAGARIELDLPNHRAAAAHIPAQALQGLSNNPHIEYIEQDVPRYPLSQTTPYGITMVQADQLLDTNAGNRTVCIIDSGFDLGHEDLPSGSNVDGVNGDAGVWYQDGLHHGTHVAGTIAALNNNVGVVGVLPNSNINLFIVRVFADDGSWTYSSGLVGALDQCENAGANVVSMSLGGTFKSRTEDRAFAAAYARGVLPIAAAGNDGNTRMSYPASYASVVSVAAVDENGQVASFSQQNSQVELSAPGVGVLSSVPMGTGSSTVLTVGFDSIAAEAMDGSPYDSASGALVNCGIGDAPCAGASGKVCLIQRGTVAFSDKVLNCEAGGGAAAVIYNNEAGPLFGTLGGVATSIPSVGISDTDGAALTARLGDTATVTISVDNYAAWDGTSMATPHVSGVAALIWSYDPSWTNDEIRDAMASTAVDLGAQGRDNAYGWGLVQAKAAVDYLTGGSSCTITESPEASCSDGVDNDCDGLTDGADGDCAVSCTITESPEVSCFDSIDNDCDGFFDLDDSDCNTGGGCTLGQSGDSCSSNAECCSGKCRGKSGSQSCR